MSLQAQKYPNNIRTISGLINLVLADDSVILCNTSGGAVALTLQEFTASYWSTQYKLYICDNSNNAATNNITINAPAGYTINGASSFVINTNGGSTIIRITSNTQYIAQVISSGGLAQAYQTIQNEATPLTQRDTMNFIGSSVNATDDSVNARTDITIQAYNTIQEEGVALAQRDTIDFVGSLVTATDTGAKTSVAINNNAYYCDLSIGTTYAPPSGIINGSSPVAGEGIPDGQVISKYTRIISNGTVVTATSGAGNYVTSPPSSSFGSMDNVNGIFTINQAGLYLLEANIHLKPDNTSSVFWSTSANGQFGLGITPDNATDIYGGNYQSILQNVSSQIDITTSVFVRVLSASPTLAVKLKALNRTSRNYDGTGYTSPDVIRLGIIKIY